MSILEGFQYSTEKIPSQTDLNWVSTLLWAGGWIRWITLSFFDCLQTSCLQTEFYFCCLCYASLPEGISVFFNEKMGMSILMDVSQEMETKYTKENNLFCNQSFTVSPIPALPKYFSPSHPMQTAASLHLKKQQKSSHISSVRCLMLHFRLRSCLMGRLIACQWFCALFCFPLLGQVVVWWWHNSLTNLFHVKSF